MCVYDGKCRVLEVRVYVVDDSNSEVAFEFFRRQETLSLKETSSMNAVNVRGALPGLDWWSSAGY